MITVSFHSYKGGACRTSTCINTLPFLALKLDATPDRPLLVIDADLESQGLTYLFEKETHFRNTEYDAKELFSGRRFRSYSEYFVPVGDVLGLEKESVYFLGVNDRKKFSAQNQGGQGPSILSLLEKQDVCGVVYDTASGEQFSANATNRASDIIVCCMRPTQQFRTGTFSFWGKVGKYWVVPEDEQIRKVILLPTAVPEKETIIGSEKQRVAALDKINRQINRIEWEMNGDFVTEAQFGIPEVERFKWCEDVLYRLDKEHRIGNEPDSRKALQRYEDLAQKIIDESELY